MIAVVSGIRNVKMHVFEGATADEVWLKAAAEFEDSAAVREQSSRAGQTRELLGGCVCDQGPPPAMGGFQTTRGESCLRSRRGGMDRERTP